MWWVVPFSDFAFHWRPDSQMRIQEVAETSVAFGLLEAGDVVQAIDGVPVYRGQAVYRFPKQAEYLFTVERNGAVVDVMVPFLEQPSSLAISYRLPMTVLTTAFLMVGIVILHFAQQNNQAALYTGYLFLISAGTTMGIQATLLNVPFAWVWRPFLYVMGVSYVYLGFLPQTVPLSARTKKVLKIWLAIAVVLGGVALWEAVVLFPNGSSIEEWVGASLYGLAFLSSGVGWLIGFGILGLRAWRMEPNYERQQVILLLFLSGLAILPAVLLTMLPRALWDVAILPFPLASMLFLLLPAGYFYVIYRRGFLGLDIVFSRTVIFITLALVMVMVYGVGLFLLQRFFFWGADNNTPAVLMFLPTLALSIYSSRPINKLIHGLFFGQQIDQTLPAFTTALSSKPELTTLEKMVVRLGDELRCAQGLLVLNNETGYLLAVAKVGEVIWEPLPRQAFTPFVKPLLRSAIRPRQSVHPLLVQQQWMELIVPIMVRGEQIGFLAFSRPQPDGYFNVEQVRCLERVAEIVAVSSEAIYLFEASRRHSLQLLAAQDTERKRLASMLHDSPLQTMVFMTHKIHAVASDACACKAEAAASLQEQVVMLQQTMNEIREICVGLYPPIIEMGSELVVGDVCRQFELEYGLPIEVEVDLEPTFRDCEEWATAVYRVLVEALNNVLKHALATRVVVSLYDEDGWLHLVVADDGQGAALADLSLSDLIRRQHLGVVGMVEWAKQSGGKLLFEENWPKGMRVRLQIPLSERAE